MWKRKRTGRIRLQNRLISTKEKANKVKVIEEIKLSKPITYKAGATSDKKLAKEWINFLKSNKAKQILKEYQFSV